MNIAKTVLFLALCALLVSVGCGRLARNTVPFAAQSGLSTASSVLSPGDVTRSLTWDGRERTVIIHLPPTINALQKFPILIVLHGGGGNAENVAKQTGMSRKADMEKFIAAYPDGSGKIDDQLLTWNSGNCCGYALDNQIDDVGFLRALIASLQAQYPVDPKRIYATGISNGGMMSYRIACELADQIAAIAPISGALNTECKPVQPVSVIAFHGTADENVPYNGGVGARSIDRHPRTDQSVAFAINLWASRDGCASVPRRTEKGDILRDEYPSCASGTSVVLYTLQGGGHAWPGGGRVAWFLDPPVKEISATDVMWEFFAAHPKL